jgi:DNA-binding MarR family transcriptional regulator
MSSVKHISRTAKYSKSLRLDDYEPKHLGYLFERATRHSRAEIFETVAELGDMGRFDELTPAYFRLLSLMPDGPTRVTDLARLSGMTKQALGQFVALLEPLGYVQSTSSLQDKRVRMIQRTAKGDEVVVTSNDLWDRIERKWRRQIGAQRYAIFREVLIDLATGWDPDEVSVDE